MTTKLPSPSPLPAFYADAETFYVFRLSEWRLDHDPDGVPADFRDVFSDADRCVYEALVVLDEARQIDADLSDDLRAQFERNLPGFLAAEGASGPLF